MLKSNPYTYLKPEQVNSLEIGYRGLLARKRLYVDADAYYTIYRNFIAQVEANVPAGRNPDSLVYYLADRTQQTRYRLWTNAKTTVYNYGVSLGLRYSFDGEWAVGGNASLARLARTANSDGLEEAFNTPRWITNVSVSNANLWRGVGAALTYKYQDAFLWQSSLATGTVPAIHTVDAQLTYRLPKQGLAFKLGGTNLLNHYYYTFIGGPAVGGFYYTALTWETGR